VTCILLVQALQHRRELARAHARLQQLHHERGEAVNEAKSCKTLTAQLEARLAMAEASLTNQKREQEGLLVEIRVVKAENAALADQHLELDSRAQDWQRTAIGLQEQVEGKADELVQEINTRLLQSAVTCTGVLGELAPGKLV